MAVKKRFPYQAAFVACNGGCRATADCQYGCVGCELCVNVCRFEAIALNDYGVAEVNEDKCIACGKCVRECPRELIRIHECANPVVVKCSNKDPGKDARKMCEVSCIGCGICQKLWSGRRDYRDGQSLLHRRIRLPVLRPMRRQMPPSRNLRSARDSDRETIRSKSKRLPFGSLFYVKKSIFS